MKSNLKSILTLSLLAILATTAGCAKGEKGEKGENGSGRIVSTINCAGTVSGVTSPATVLNGLVVEYNAILTAGGDVYASSNIIDEVQQVSGTEFYAAGQNGAVTAMVKITSDQHSTADAAVWSVELDRTTLQTKVTYDDDSLPAVVSMNFASSACTVQNW